MKRACLLLFIVFVFIFIPSIHAQINFFDDPNQDLGTWGAGKAVGDSLFSTVSVTLGTVSTTRTLQQTILTKDDPASFNSYIYGFGGDRYFGVNNGGGDSSEGLITWGGAADMHLDLLSYGDSFSFTHFSNDGVPGGEVVISVWNGTTVFTSPTIALTNTSFSPPTGYDYSIPFSSFIGADFTNVDKITFSLKGPNAIDVEVSNFAVVPEPGSMVLVGVCGLMGLLQRKRSRTRSRLDPLAEMIS